MHSVTAQAIGLLALAASQASAIAIPFDTSIGGPITKRATRPFNQIVAYGDELSDNGNGSYAHGITGDPANVYGFGTWTDGPVAVSYLANLYGVPLRDLAWGGCCGGGSFGGTIDNSYTPAAAQYNGAPVPSVHDQVQGNYSASHPNINTDLQFIWVGQNDLSKHTDAFYLGDSRNTDFATQISSRIVAEAEYLVKAGAPYVFVANIYPKHLAPVTTTYLCPDGSCIDTWGQIIQQANTAIKNALAASKYSKQLIYHDVFGFMTNLMLNKDYYGYTTSLSWFCDGDGNGNWTACISGKRVWDGAKTYYWMNWVQPTTRVHEMIAVDMKNTIDKFLGL